MTATVAQCKSCPWRVDCEPFEDIPGGYSLDKHKNLACTIAKSPLDGVLDGTLRAMACHHSRPGAEFHCAGWIHNQLGPGNNIAVRLRVMGGLMPVPTVDGEQHERFEDTIPKERDARPVQRKRTVRSAVDSQSDRARSRRSRAR